MSDLIRPQQGEAEDSENESPLVVHLPPEVANLLRHLNSTLEASAVNIIHAALLRVVSSDVQWVIKTIRQRRRAAGLPEVISVDEVKLGLPYACLQPWDDRIIWTEWFDGRFIFETRPVPNVPLERRRSLDIDGVSLVTYDDIDLHGDWPYKLAMLEICKCFNFRSVLLRPPVTPFRYPELDTEFEVPCTLPALIEWIEQTCRDKFSPDNYEPRVCYETIVFTIRFLHLMRIEVDTEWLSTRRAAVAETIAEEIELFDLHDFDRETWDYATTGPVPTGYEDELSSITPTLHKEFSGPGFREAMKYIEGL